ncbi:PhzF family phenazine biosynthesis protein [Agaribacterium haliotis]|uniref:PhzF family phenazine biosynthesis protein n=1 Tax=Agaribacterium haliotis TaxID=2013869 RepID=UPI000BB58688|nr:PhzF family phenazine biosynthesis protein [Agaribacterium haliotis]
MKLDIDIVDAFTEKQFQGNSAAVVIAESWLDEKLMQAIATENNLSETAFLLQHSSTHYDIRWFSPITEIDFCGHATLASAFVIFNRQPELTKLTFSAKAVGQMSIVKKDDGHIEMDFPARKPQCVDKVPAELLEGLSIQPSSVLLNKQAYFAIYQNEADVLALTYNKQSLQKLAPFDVVVSAAASEYDFVSRYFWPANGGDEDPVTGSIHTGLAPYWAEQLGKTELLAYQASKRGGILNCRLQGDRVFISGKAVLYLQGFIHI